MSDRNIYRALSERLSTFTHDDNFEIAWSPELFNPSNAGAFLRPSYLPEAPETLTTNPIQTKINVLYEVDCFAPERSGIDAALGFADGVSAHFFPLTGTTFELPIDGGHIQINNRPEIKIIEQRGAHVGVGVLIRCFALIN